MCGCVSCAGTDSPRAGDPHHRLPPPTVHLPRLVLLPAPSFPLFSPPSLALSASPSPGPPRSPPLLTVTASPSSSPSSPFFHCTSLRWSSSTSSPPSPGTTDPLPLFSLSTALPLAPLKLRHATDIHPTARMCEFQPTTDSDRVCAEQVRALLHSVRPLLPVQGPLVLLRGAVMQPIHSRGYWQKNHIVPGGFPLVRPNKDPMAKVQFKPCRTNKTKPCKTIKTPSGFLRPFFSISGADPHIDLQLPRAPSLRRRR